jgi:hypothetical protein
VVSAVSCLDGSTPTHDSESPNCPLGRDIAEEACDVLEDLQHADVVRGGCCSRAGGSGGGGERLVCELAHGGCQGRVCGVGGRGFGYDTAAGAKNVAERAGLVEEAGNNHEQVGRRWKVRGHAQAHVCDSPWGLFHSNAGAGGGCRWEASEGEQRCNYLLGRIFVSGVGLPFQRPRSRSRCRWQPCGIRMGEVARHRVHERRGDGHPC